ncbi:MAG: hypothetical protein ACJAT2_002175 [Bacteriovoracaceae bacterium]|jgi:hypothetical protein
MNIVSERSVLGAIECHELLGEHNKARVLRRKYDKRKERKRRKKESQLKIQKDQIFEGTLVAAGWDKLDHINQSSLYTQEDEDILLEHKWGMKKFKPFLNQKVRIKGDIVSSIKDGRRVLVKEIIRLRGGFSESIYPHTGEFYKLLTPIAA